MKWYRELRKDERRTFIAAFGGWALDGVDFMMFTFVLGTLMSIWHIDRTQAGMLGTVTLLVSAVGGWMAGILADRYGRVRVMQWTILWFSVCTLMLGFAQNFEQAFVLRALQGLGFGGEWAVGSVLMGEIVRGEHRGKAVGTVQSAWAVGWGISAIAYTVLYSFVPEELAWRILFWIGILPALLVFYIRKNVPEPQVSANARAAAAARGERIPFTRIFSPQLLRITLLTSLLCTGVQGGYYAITIWLPTFLRTKYHLSVLDTGGYLMVVIVGSFTGYIVGAYLTDWWGRRANLYVFTVLSGISVWFYSQYDISNSQMLLLGFPLGFAASGIYSGLGSFLTELFPASVRANGQGFAYSFGRAVGALFPTLVGHLSERIGLAGAIGAFAGGAYVLVLIAATLLPETRGKDIGGTDSGSADSPTDSQTKREAVPASAE
ncbi:MFS transporter [Cupriavidus pampae]|uniref:Metabolite transport protein YjhB n=1 Tax=Cupriavidus pampae TaxID=659251 RepID=A0ABM8WB23_9BURK|nr:MFS transporter [Cupriavidus pampae]CAG9164478.1 Putative metabolite transport protein YjhB [Cupriavidus pampae]